jgi:hypothetical protein
MRWRGRFSWVELMIVVRNKWVTRGYVIAEAVRTANGKITIYSFYALPAAKWSM